MKVNFLKQIARMLVFSLFVAGFPVNMQAASPAPSSSSSCPGCTDVVAATLGAPLAPGALLTTAQQSTLSSTAAPTGCKGFVAATCNLNNCMTNKSPNSPTTFDLSKMAALTGDDAKADPNVIQNSLQTINNLLTAMVGDSSSGGSTLGYAQVSQNYANLSGVLSALGQLQNNYLMVNPCALNYSDNSNNSDGTPSGCPTTNPGGWTFKVLPFTATNISQESRVSSYGDFASVGNLTNDQKAQLMLGYIQYMYSIQSSDHQIGILADLVAMILYTTLAKQMNYWDYYYWAYQAFANQAIDSNGVGKQPACPTPTDVLNFINDSSMVDQNRDGSYKPSSQFQFTNGTIPNNILNLLSAVANAQWTAINRTDLYNVISAIDINGLTSTFMNLKTTENTGPNAFVPFMVSSMQTLVGSNIYFRCDRYFTTGSGYTAGQPIEQGSFYYSTDATPASVKLSDQFALFLQQAAAPSQPFPTSVTDFVGNYMTGNFYNFLPSLTTSSKDTSLVQLDFSSLWTTACSNKSSGQIAGAQSGIISQIQTVGGVETPKGAADSLGTPIYPGNTLQGAAQNLINAAQAAVVLAPISPTYSSKYSWVNGSFTPQQDPNDTVPGTTFIPTTLSGFSATSATDTTSFLTADHLSMLLDVVTIVSNYDSCWNNLTLCTNLSNGGTNNNKSSSILSQIEAQLKNPVTYIMLVGITALMHPIMKGLGKAWDKLTGAEAKAKAAAAADRQAMIEQIKAELSGPKNSNMGDDPVGADISASTNELPPANDGGVTTGPDSGQNSGSGTDTSPVSDASVDAMQSAIKDQISNIRNLSDADLDVLAQKVAAIMKKAQADEAAGETDAATEEATAKTDEAAVETEAKETDNTTAEGDFDAL